MSGTLVVDNIRNSANTVNFPVSYFKRRLVQKLTRRYPGGAWNPSNTYWEIPGSFLGITPQYDNSYIIYTYSGPLSHINGWSAHCITHWIFYAYGNEQCRFSRSVDHIENNAIFRWQIPSEGAGKACNAGFYARQYSNGNHGAHFNARRYRDGSNVSGELVGAYISMEEYVST